MKNHLKLWIAMPLLGVMLSGCPNLVSISAEDIEKFGSVQSAVWYKLTYIVDGETHDSYHYFMLSNRGGLCNALKAENEIQQDYTNDLAQLLEDMEYDQICDLEMAKAADMAGAVGKFHNEGARMLGMTFWALDGDYFSSVEPDDGEWGTPDWDMATVSMEPYFDLYVDFYSGDYYAEYVDAISEVDGYCETDWEALDALYDYFYMDDGTATVTHKGSNKINIEFSGKLLDDEGEDAGDIEGKMDATLCEIDFVVDALPDWY